MSNDSSICDVSMADERKCNRPIHDSPLGIDPTPVCLMHSLDPEKAREPLLTQFREKFNPITRLLPPRNSKSGSSPYVPTEALRLRATMATATACSPRR